MAEPQGVNSLDDILHDEDGTQRRAVCVLRCFSDGRPSAAPRIYRDIRPRAVTSEEPVELSGDQLVARRPPGRRVRYTTLLHLEAQHRVDLDFGYLIALACQILESEIVDLLLSPAAPFANHLAELTRDAGKVRKAEVLEAWADGRPPTIGIASLVLMALRYGLRAKDAMCGQFIASHFRPHYCQLAARRQLGACIDRLRETYRNPACHGRGSFDRDDYYEFSRLLVWRPGNVLKAIALDMSKAIDNPVRYMKLSRLALYNEWWEHDRPLLLRVYRPAAATVSRVDRWLAQSGESAR